MPPKAYNTSRAPATATKNLIQVRDEETGAIYHFACRTCINGHRAPSCNPAKHRGKILMRRPPPGRPATNCDHAKGANCGCNDRNLCTRLTKDQWDEVCEGKVATARMFRTVEDLEASTVKTEPATRPASSLGYSQQQSLAIRSAPPTQSDPQYGSYTTYETSPTTHWASPMATPMPNQMVNPMPNSMANSMGFVNPTYAPVWPGNMLQSPQPTVPGYWSLPGPLAQFPCPNCASTNCRCTACPPTMQAADSGAWAKACARRSHVDAQPATHVQPAQMLPQSFQQAQHPSSQPFQLAQNPVSQPFQQTAEPPISQPFQPDWATHQYDPQLFEDPTTGYPLPGLLTQPVADQDFFNFDLSGTAPLTPGWQ